jgi:methyl-accepting chemotaxis protein
MNSLFSLFSRLELSPSKGLWLQAALGAVAVAALLLESQSPLAIGLAVAIVLVLILSVRGQMNEAALVQRMNKVLSGAANGVLEPRVTNIRNSGPLADCAWSLNEVLDQVEAVFRESLTVVSRMSAGNFSRQPQPAGLKGIYPQVLLKMAEAQHSVSRTVKELRAAMGAMAEGDFSVRLDTSKDQGEYKLILENAQLAIGSLDEVLGDVVRVMDAMVRGDLTSRVHAQSQGSLAKLKDDINRSLDALAQSMRSIGGNAQQVAGAANDTSTAIGQLADGAQSQTHYISEVVTAIRQTSIAVSDISKSTESASAQAQQSANIVSEGREKMEQMVEVVNGIARNSEKINKITDVIEKIANKTNLLSLNAAIEAARAGEHGKGFAVVADEVGKLAASSADSTKEITQLIQQAVSEANRAVFAVREVSGDMERIVQSSTQTDGMLQRISAAVEEQTRTMQEINNSVSNLEKIAHSNSSASEELAASMIELSGVADSTRREIEKFKI